MRNSRVSLALTAALAGAAVSMAPQQATAQFNENGTGQVLIFPYYTVNDGWSTLFNVTNTSSAALAVKVRFHEYANSRDVLDFNVLMSPFDAWTGWVQAGATEEDRPRFFTNDNSCTSPLNVSGLELNELAYTGDFADAGAQDTGRLREGYVELIVMGACANGDTACFRSSDDPATPDVDERGMGFLTKHVDGTPNDCVEADSRFVNTIGAGDTQGSWVPGTIPGDGEPLAAFPYHPGGYKTPDQAAGDVGPLKGNASYLNTSQGIGAGNEALALEGWYTGSGNMVTAQQFPWFLEPTIATGNGVWDATTLESAIESVMTRRGVINEWSSKELTGDLTDWVVNFPTKGYHVDQDCNNIQANNNRYRVDGTTVLDCNATNDALYLTEPRTDAPVLAPFENKFDGDSTILVEYAIFDREEGGIIVETSGTTPSPAPPPELVTNELRWETNVLRVGATGESAFATQQGGTVDTSALLSGAQNGWVGLQFINGNSIAPGGLPTVGFIMKRRFQDDPEKAYGQAMRHAYIPQGPLVDITP